MSTLIPLFEVEMLLDLWKCGPSYIVILEIRALKSEKCNKTLISVQVLISVQNVNFGASVWLLIHFPLFLIKSATIGCSKGCVGKIATNYQY